ncbi:MAG: hypothetical protein EZS28_003500 [Streblomastix strix]|uniref:Uncharacterized protein n=1 Tax=Streblomastix strix TaxID=222440 RepID=A0A5J4X2J4_9EUKA|nr:MAG: hypothetical protein EZS28_003500 [Streblomastix strix]
MQAKIMKGQTYHFNKKVRQWATEVTNYYPRLYWRQGYDLLFSYLLIPPLAHPKYVTQPEMIQKQGDNSLWNSNIEHAERRRR